MLTTHLFQLCGQLSYFYVSKKVSFDMSMTGRRAERGAKFFEPEKLDIFRISVEKSWTFQEVKKSLRVWSKLGFSENFWIFWAIFDFLKKNVFEKKMS